MGAHSDVRLRPYRRAEFVQLLSINEQSTPGVSSETADSLEQVFSVARVTVAESDNLGVLGFISLVKPGTEVYESPNLRWFEAWQVKTRANLIYVDRIALSPAARGQGVGERLYKAAFQQSANYDEIVCEVNTKPDNPGSHRFHQRLGFRRVGEAEHSAEKAVAFYARPIRQV